MSVMHISIYMNVIGLTPSLDLCTLLYPWAKKWEGLIWGFRITVLCYKNELLQTPVLSLELLNAKYHVSSKKHLFSWPTPFISISSEYSLKADLQSMPLFPLFLISQYIIAAWLGACWKNTYFIRSCGRTQNTKCKALKKQEWHIGQVNSSR